MFNKFLNYLRLNDEDEFDDYDEYEDEVNRERELEERRARAAQRSQRKRDRYEDEDRYEREEPRRERRDRDYNRNYSSRDRDTRTADRDARAAAGERTSSRAEQRGRQQEAEERTSRRGSTRMERTTNNKIVPIRTTSHGMEVCIIKPTTFGDSQDICDMLLNGRAVIVNLEGFDPGEAQRIIDFVCGSVYAMNGKLHSVAKYIFIFSPASVDISGDFAEFFQESGFGVPTFNKEF
ncbi:cell division protein SepF [Anaerolentibacter hominis]|uniref:cell division protein SepF n=1 Tax=Anaerolentibacter hominis TaxID=3079009 RepID=UPI0031B83B54